MQLLYYCYFLVRMLVTTHWSFRGIVLHLITLNDTHGHTLTHKEHSVEPLWTSDRPVAETSTLQHTTLTTDRYP